MNVVNLEETIKGGESETLEFKEKFDERTKSAVAFASTKCCMILTGVIGADRMEEK